MSYSYSHQPYDYDGPAPRPEAAHLDPSEQGNDAGSSAYRQTDTTPAAYQQYQQQQQQQQPVEAYPWAGTGSEYQAVQPTVPAADWQGQDDGGQTYYQYYNGQYLPVAQPAAAVAAAFAAPSSWEYHQQQQYRYDQQGMSMLGHTDVSGHDGHGKRTSQGPRPESSKHTVGGEGGAAAGVTQGSR